MKLKSIYSQLVFLSILLYLPIVISGCGSDDGEEEVKDTEKPVIQITSPSSGKLLRAFIDPIRVEGTITDNYDLESTTISLEYVGEMESAVNVENEELKSSVSGIGAQDQQAGIYDEPYSLDPVTIEISGESFSFQEEFPLPFGTSPVPYDVKFGKYKLIFEAEDAAGNIADPVSVEIKIGQ